MIVIYHNPKCKIVGKCLEYLETKKNDQFQIKHRDTPITFNKLKNIVRMLGCKPIDIVRTRHFLWKTIFKNLDFSDDELLEVLLEYPRLVKKPIVINGNKAIIGRPPERILEIL